MSKHKNLIIVHSYCPSIEKESIMVDCISRFKEFGYDVLHISNFPVRDRYQALSDYYFHNNKNILLDRSKSRVRWFANNIFYISIYPNCTSYTCCRNCSIGANMALLLGYDSFIYTDYDNIIGYKDANVISDLFHTLEKADAIFFDSGSEKESFYEITMVGGSSRFFSENLKLPKTIDEWEADRSYTLPNGNYRSVEEGTAHKILPFIKYNNIKIIKSDNKEHRMGNIFPNSEIDKCTPCGVGVAYNPKDKTKPYVYLVNKKGCEHKVYIDGELINLTNHGGQFSATEVNIENEAKDIKVLIDNELMFDRSISISNIKEYESMASVGFFPQDGETITNE
jgi:hypothetical protein